VQATYSSEMLPIFNKAHMPEDYIFQPRITRLGPLLFLFCINDLPEVVKNNSKPDLFADDTIVIVSNPDLVNFKNDLTFSFEQLNAWFSINLLSLNYDKT
jgi:hypothetical protein